jgi:hypothetical protein
MPFDVVHPRDFPERFGVNKAPSKSALKRWRQAHGFPASLTVPRGHYRADEVAAWFAALSERRSKSPQAA